MPCALRIVKSRLVFKPIHTKATARQFIRLLVCLRNARTRLLKNAADVRVKLGGIWVWYNQLEWRSLRTLYLKREERQAYIFTGVEPYILIIEGRPLARLRYESYTIGDLGLEDIDFWSSTPNICPIGMHRTWVRFSRACAS